MERSRRDFSAGRDNFRRDYFAFIRDSIYFRLFLRLIFYSRFIASEREEYFSEWIIIHGLPDLVDFVQQSL